MSDGKWSRDVFIHGKTWPSKYLCTTCPSGLTKKEVSCVGERKREREAHSSTKPQRQREVSVMSEVWGGGVVKGAWPGSAETLATPIWLQTDKREYCSKKL